VAVAVAMHIHSVPVHIHSVPVHIHSVAVRMPAAHISPGFPSVVQTAEPYLAHIQAEALAVQHIQPEALAVHM